MLSVLILYYFYIYIYIKYMTKKILRYVIVLYNYNFTFNSRWKGIFFIASKKFFLSSFNIYRIPDWKYNGRLRYVTFMYCVYYK